MARKKTAETKRPIESYEHKGKQRVNNPSVGLVTPDTDSDAGAKKIYGYDAHLAPQLQWANTGVWRSRSWMTGASSV